MEYEALMSKGVELMLVGMGTVFVYLGFLVFVVKAVSKVARAIGAEEEMATANTAVPLASVAAHDVPVVIAAAVHQYRSDQAK